MEIETLNQNDVALIRFKTSLEDTKKIKNQFDQLELAQYQHVLLDMRHQNWLSSREIGTLMAIYKQLSEIDISFSILANSPVMLQTVQATGMDYLFSVYESKEQALKNI